MFPIHINSSHELRQHLSIGFLESLLPNAYDGEDHRRLADLVEPSESP